jgi:plastocyanin
MTRTTLLAIPALALCAATLSAQSRAATPGAVPTAAAKTQGTVIRVRMTQTGARYAFEPANFTVRQGDIVEFVNISGFPHNVQFEKTKIPAGAEAVLNTNMTGRLGNLQGPMMMQPNQVYRVSFANAPVGTYDYFCLPHKAMNMKGVITVQAGR